MSTKKYLDYDGLLYLWQKIKTTFALASSAVSNVSYNSSSKKIQQTKGSTTTDVVTLSTVATSGSYDDLSNKPTIPSGVEKTTTTPKMDGTAAIGSEVKFAAGDHVHPTDTSRAPLASPALTGTPTAPTATSGTNTTQIATTAFVKTAVDSAVTGAATFQGTAPTTFAPTNYKAGYYWIVGTAGTYAGETCEVGDMIFCTSNYSSAYSASDFDVVQTNMDVTSISNGEIDTILAT